MQLFQDLFDRSKQLNQAPSVRPEAYHAQQGRYKIIHQALKIPNLPAPLHYLNFYTMLGQPRAAIFQQSHLNLQQPLQSATVLSSISPHMVGQLNSYHMNDDCAFEPQRFQFGQREQLTGTFPNFSLQRLDQELSFDLKIQIIDAVSYYCQLRWALGQYWSLPCLCQGELHYQGHQYKIEQIGVFEYARAIHFSYLPLAFWVYQLIPLSDCQQLIVLQLRDQFNSLLYSRLYLKDLQTLNTYMYDQGVHFKIHRVYPCVTTPNRQQMYLPREFEWSYQDNTTQMKIIGQSRGDFKFGLGAGYVGSFSYQVQVNDQHYVGEHGYCEYIDCRSLKWQEQHESEHFLAKIGQPKPILLKKR